jgi:hypothetical protein
MGGGLSGYLFQLVLCLIPGDPVRHRHTVHDTMVAAAQPFVKIFPVVSGPETCSPADGERSSGAIIGFGAQPDQES